MNVRKIIIGGCACLLVAWLVTGAVIAEGFPCKGELTGDNVNVRTGPSTKHAKVTKLSRGDTVTVHARQGDWYKIAAPSKLTVWVHKKYVTVEENTGTITADRVNVRHKAAKGDVLGQVSKGVEVTVVSRSGDWVGIEPVAGAHVWISAKYVRIEEEDASEEARPLPPVAIPEPGVKAADAEPGTLPDDVDITDAFSADLVKDLEKLKAEQIMAAKNEDHEKIASLSPEIKRLRNIIESPAYQAYKKRKGIALNLQRTIDEIEEAAKRALEEIKKKNRVYVAEGRVFCVAPCLSSSPPGMYKLKQGNTVLFYLKSVSETVDLKVMRFKKVGIVGKIVPSKKGWDIPTIEVTDIYPLDE